jgi:hypothetical protein
MADFTGTVLTQKGRNLLSKAQTGATLTFTKIKIGDGTWATGTDPTQLNDLVDPKLSLPIQAVQVIGDGTVRLRFVLTNTGLQQGFFMREIGIYAQDPDLGEILYAVAYASDRADFIPSDGVTKVENVVDIYTVIANTQNVTAVISDTVVIATKQDVDNLNTQLTTQINTVNTQLTNQVNTVKPELGATAPTLTYTGKLWLNANTKFLQYFDGSNWQNVSVSNADKVDGFDASQTPAPNVIVPLNASGILDLSKTYIKSDAYSFRRIDLSNASSSYDLQVGEEAYISFNNVSSRALYITTNTNRIYEIILQFTVNVSNSNSYTFLNPNDTTYSSSFSHCSYYWNSGGGSGWGAYSTSDNAFKIYNQTPHTYMIVDTFRRTMKGIIDYEYGDSNIGYGFFVSKWQSTSTAWTSLGTFTFPQSMSGVILVRRLA